MPSNIPKMVKFNRWRQQLLNPKFVHNEIKKNSNILSRQQIRTLYGQIKKGEVEAAYKGLQSLMKKMSKNNVSKGDSHEKR